MCIRDRAKRVLRTMDAPSRIKLKNKKWMTALRFLAAALVGAGIMAGCFFLL